MLTLMIHTVPVNIIFWKSVKESETDIDENCDKIFLLIKAKKKGDFCKFT